MKKAIFPNSCEKEKTVDMTLSRVEGRARGKGRRMNGTHPTPLSPTTTHFTFSIEKIKLIIITIQLVYECSELTDPNRSTSSTLSTPKELGAPSYGQLSRIKFKDQSGLA